MVFKDHSDLQGLRAYKELRVLLEFKVLKERQVHRVFKELKVQ